MAILPETTPDQLSLEDCTNSRSARAQRRITKTGPPRPTSDRKHHTVQELLETRDALLTRTHLRELGLERRAVDAIFRILPVVALPGYSRPMIRAQEYLALIARSTYNGDRVRP
jgi:hypothetical protein